MNSNRSSDSDYDQGSFEGTDPEYGKRSRDSRRVRGGDDELDELKWGSIDDWIQLVRIPTVFTLLSNVVAATILCGSFFRPITGFVPTLIASIMAYWAGMILNDVVDVEEDRRDRPDRPLAAGRISPALAKHVANAMLLLGPIIILGVTTFHKTQPLWQGAAFASSVLLSLCILAYDSPLKQTPLGPMLMGGCRSINILMVGCTLFSLSDGQEFPDPVVYFALGIGLYIMGITVFARHEETNRSDSGGLLLGLLFEVAGLIVIGFLPRWGVEEQAWTLDPSRGYPLLVGLVGLTVINRGFKAISHPVSRKVQLAVKHALLTLILIDAAVVLMWAGPWYGCAVVMLLLPALSSAIRFRAT